jgi:hypothetical protein
MKALIYHGLGEKEWESKSEPGIERATDMIMIFSDAARTNALKVILSAS